MSKVNGRLVTCDRCGAEVFIKLIDSKELDGGFSRVSKFEALPEGWKWYSALDADLCPTCSEEWLELEADFMNKKAHFLEEAK